MITEASMRRELALGLGGQDVGNTAMHFRSINADCAGLQKRGIILVPSSLSPFFLMHF